MQIVSEGGADGNSRRRGEKKNTACGPLTSSDICMGSLPLGSKTETENGVENIGQLQDFPREGGIWLQIIQGIILTQHPVSDPLFTFWFSLRQKVAMVVILEYQKTSHINSKNQKYIDLSIMRYYKYL